MVKKNVTKVKFISLNKLPFFGDRYSVRTVKPVGHFDCHRITGIDKLVVSILETSTYGNE